jgi:hypothetical protein
VFSQPEIKELFSKYILLRLYTDGLPDNLPKPADSADANKALLKDRYGTTALPYYVIIRPTKDGGFETVAEYDEGKINHPDRFAEFLRSNLPK